MARIVLDEKITNADDCPFGKWSNDRGCTICMFGLYQTKCMAQDIWGGITFNMDLCDYITAKE